jgi:hypothetical protein
MRRCLIPLTLVCLTVAVTHVAAEEKKAVTPFNGTDLKGWKIKGDEKKSKWKVGAAVWDEKTANKVSAGEAKEGKGDLVNEAGGVDLYTEQKFGDCTVEVEVLVPKGSNSGVYLMAEYEVQVLDSFGREKVGPGDMGGIYNTAAPKVNASKKPGEWQKFVIDFQAPRFTDGKKTANGKFLKVTLNGQLIHENVEVKGSTGGGLTGQEHETGPLMFQGDHGPVAFRNLKITPR